jgi:hypothetical protein
MNYRSVKTGLSLIAVFGSFALAGMAQQTSSGASNPSSTNSAVVPRLVNYSGVLTDINGKPLTGVVGVTFTLYQDSEGGTPLWMEIQNVAMSKSGRYSVMLGSTSSEGLPQDVFVTGEARWLGVRAEEQAEQPRVLLVAVPYALKAGDAETIGGLPASAFMLANGSSAGTSNTKPAAPASSSASKNSAPPANPAVTGKGTVNYIPMWDTTSDIIDSVIFQKSSQIGIGTTAPAATLDVSGKADVRDTLTLFPKSTDNTLAVSGTAFNISSLGKVTFIPGQTFPGAGTITGITTASGSGLSGGGTTGTLSLKVPAAGITNAMLADSKITLNGSTAGGLTVPGAMTLGSTYTIGLKTCSASQVLQYSGTAWACASAGTGTVTSVASGAGLTGGPITKTGTLSIASAGVTNAMLANSKVTLNSGTGITAPGAMTLGDTYTVSINTAVVPQLAAANTFTNTETITANSSNPALNLANTGAGDGIVINTAQGNGISVDSALNYGVVGFGGYTGGYFNGPGYGSYSENDAETNFAPAAYGASFGSTAATVGVSGYTASSIGAGVYGQSVEASTTGTATDGGSYPIGVWGDSGAQFGFGAFGSADDGWSFVGYNNSPSGFSTTWFENQETNDSASEVLFAYGSGFGGMCNSDVSGNFSCNGTFAAVAPVAGGLKKVALSSIQSPENWFEDAGGGQLSGGEAVVNIESVFGETVNTGVEYRVFLTPNGECKGLYVAQKSASSFVVRELGGGTSNIAFDYRIMAKRKGFEQIRLADKTKAFSLKNRPIKPAGAGAKHMPSAQEVRKQMQERLKAGPVAALSTPVLNKKR